MLSEAIMMPQPSSLSLLDSLKKEIVFSLKQRKKSPDIDSMSEAARLGSRLTSRFVNGQWSAKVMPSAMPLKTLRSGPGGFVPGGLPDYTCPLRG